MDDRKWILGYDDSKGSGAGETLIHRPGIKYQFHLVLTAHFYFLHYLLFFYLNDFFQPGYGKYLVHALVQMARTHIPTGIA